MLLYSFETSDVGLKSQRVLGSNRVIVCAAICEAIDAGESKRAATSV